jgi:tryptophanyl-tRNA synthetase
MAEAKRKRVVSGMRPTGRLHIGHYFGALQNWVRLQNDPDYDCFYFIADWHALTSDYADTSGVAQNVLEIMTDYLAAGLVPKVRDEEVGSVIFQQSQIPEHAELHLLLSMVTPLGWLERVPTYKEALENIKDKDLHTYGFLGYPLLQCADIVIYSEEGVPLFVPVGEDQVSHVELSREIVRRSNAAYADIDWERTAQEKIRKLFMGIPAVHTEDGPVHGGQILLDLGKVYGIPPVVTEEEKISAKARLRQVMSGLSIEHRLARMANAGVLAKTILAEPAALLTATPRIPGTDGRKMSKSYGNAIMLSESDESIRAKTKVMMTDPARKRRQDPGNPDVCPVYDWHKLFSPPEVLKWSAEGCRTAGIGCIECKAAMADHLIKWIAPIRARRQEYEKEPARVLAALDEGSKKARAVAQNTMKRVREAVFGWEKKRGEVRGPVMKSAEARK